LPLLLRTVPSLKLSSVSANRGSRVLEVADSAPSSPKRKAALSRLGPEAGRFPDLRKGETDFGGDELRPEAEDTSGSSIHENDEFAIVDLVGIGALGRPGIAELDSAVGESSWIVADTGEASAVGVSAGTIILGRGEDGLKGLPMAIVSALELDIEFPGSISASDFEGIR